MKIAMAVASLSEIVREPIAKNSSSVKSFIQELIQKGELAAYIAEFEKKKVEEETEDELLIRITKGVSLTQVKDIPEYRLVFVEDLKDKTMYCFTADSHGGQVYNDGDQTIYNKAVL